MKQQQNRQQAIDRICDDDDDDIMKKMRNEVRVGKKLITWPISPSFASYECLFI